VPQNIEAKYRCPDLAPIEASAKHSADSGPKILRQLDTYFNVPGGRLKLREFPDTPAELIGYQRVNARQTRPSDWLVFPTTDPDRLKEVLSRTCGVSTVVTKKRTLYLIGQTRIHLDEVEELGSFVEIEVVLEEGQGEAEGQQIAEEIITKLGLNSLTPEPRSYSDLMIGHQFK